jgi:hypothetical protein
MKALTIVCSLLLPQVMLAQPDTLQWNNIWDHGWGTCQTVVAGTPIVVAVGPGYEICDFLSRGVRLETSPGCENQPDCAQGNAERSTAENFDPTAGTMFYTIAVLQSGCVSLFLDFALTAVNCEVIDPAAGFPRSYCRQIHPYSGVLLLGPFMNPQDHPVVTVTPGCMTNTNCNSSCQVPSGVAVGFNNDRSYGHYYGFHWQDQEEFPTYGCYCITLQGILPVEMGQFSAVSEGDGIRLTWNTLAESELDRFEVRRNNRLIAVEPATNNPAGHAYAWLDRNVDIGTVYRYELVIVEEDGTSRTAATIEAAARGWAANPDGHTLLSCYPNPFNPTAEIGYEMPTAGHVTLRVYDVHGRLITILANERVESGHHRVTFNGDGLPSGLYFCSLETEQGLFTRKMVLLK